MLSDGHSCLLRTDMTVMLPLMILHLVGMAKKYIYFIQDVIVQSEHNDM